MNRLDPIPYVHAQLDEWDETLYDNRLPVPDLYIGETGLEAAAYVDGKRLVMHRYWFRCSQGSRVVGPCWRPVLLHESVHLAGARGHGQKFCREARKVAAKLRIPAPRPHPGPIARLLGRKRQGPAPEIWPMNVYADRDRRFREEYQRVCTSIRRQQEESAKEISIMLKDYPRALSTLANRYPLIPTRIDRRRVSMWTRAMRVLRRLAAALILSWTAARPLGADDMPFVFWSQGTDAPATKAATEKQQRLMVIGSGRTRSRGVR